MQGGRIIQIIGYAIPVCSLAQMRRLEQVASTRRTVISASERTRRMWIEGAMCLLFPPLMLPLLYIVQGHRYDIFEGIGCQVTYANTLPGIFLKLVLPIIISVAVLVYSGTFSDREVEFDELSLGLAVRWFLVRRLQFRAILGSSHTGLSVSRYLRLIALAVIDVVILLINDIIGLASTLQQEIHPYRSWSDVHAQWSLISQIPEGQHPLLVSLPTILSVYNVPLYSIVFFLFFGLGEEAITEYISTFNKLVRMLERLGLKKQTR